MNTEGVAYWESAWDVVVLDLKIYKECVLGEYVKADYIFVKPDGSPYWILGDAHEPTEDVININSAPN